jgi:transcriptional regulator NrdR family protein
MTCPFCTGESKVTNSRPSKKHPEIWRRRQCKSCLQIWTTREVVDLSLSHRIITSQNHVEPFQRDKLFISIKDSCAHRKSALADASALTDTVLGRILTQNQATIDVDLLISLTAEIITRFDKTAGAVYRAKFKG